MENACLKDRIEQLDPETHRALRERLLSRYCKIAGDESSAGSIGAINEDDGPNSFIDHHGDLVIPFSSDRRFHWWNRGQSIEETIKEIEERLKGPNEGRK